MKTNTPTAAPEFKNPNLCVVPVKTEEKTTQTKCFSMVYAAVDFKIKFLYSTVDFKAGEVIPNVRRFQDGFTILCGYGHHAFEGIIVDGVYTKNLFIPNELLIEKTFCEVREYKTTTWEIV